MTLNIQVAIDIVSPLQTNDVILHTGCHCKLYLIWFQPKFCMGSVFTPAMGNSGWNCWYIKDIHIRGMDRDGITIVSRARPLFPGKKRSGSRD